MADSPPRSKQQQQLRQEWPRTCAQLEATYYNASDWAVTRDGTHNAAGYLLWALARYESVVALHHPQMRYTRPELDMAAGREVGYQWLHARTFRSIPAALAQCWVNLATERPIRLHQARQILMGHGGKSAADTQPKFSTW